MNAPSLHGRHPDGSTASAIARKGSIASAIDEDESIAEAIDDVVESARDVATRGVALARLEAGEAVAQGLQAGAVVLFAAIFAGFVAAALWWVAVGAVAWWLMLQLGLTAAAGWIAGVHALLVGVAWAFGRSRLGPDDEPS